ncbi:MAG: phosphatidate cytidylyltransferase [Huintestinicola sp.]
MKQRLITAGIGIAIGISILFLANTIVYPIAVAAISCIAVFELLSVCGCRRFKRHFWGCIVYAAVLPILSYYNVEYIWRYALSILAVFAMFAGYIADHKKLPFEKLCAMMTGTLLISLSSTCLVAIKNISAVHGICYVVMALMAAWVPDGGAYFVGTSLGKTKLCPEISPKKTWEGAIGGVAVTAIVFAVYGFCYQQFMSAVKGVDFEVNYLLLIAVSIICAPVSMIGDLSASLIKRENDVKDFGNLMPGHGGMMDRFDSVFFVLPFLLLVYSNFNIFV